MCMLHDHTQPECIIPGQAKCIPKSKWAPSRLGSSHNSLGKFTMVTVDDHGCQGSPPCFRLDHHGSQKITMGQGSSHSNVILLSWQRPTCVACSYSLVTTQLIWLLVLLHSARQSSIQKHQQPNQLHVLKLHALTR